MTAQPVGPLVPGWTRRPRAEAVRLEGRYVVLEPLSLAHAPALHDALGDPQDADLWTYRPHEQPRDVSAMTALVADQLAAGPEQSTFALLPTEGSGAGRAAGIASYARIEPAHGQVEIAGVLYARSLQRTRAATEAIHLTMRHAFEDLGYRRFEWKCDRLNEPSRRAAARLGFHFEGTFRHHLVVKGRSRDTDWFAVTDADWPAVRLTHERWLDAANFDDQGVQRVRLSDLSRPLLDVGGSS